MTSRCPVMLLLSLAAAFFCSTFAAVVDLTLEPSHIHLKTDERATVFLQVTADEPLDHIQLSVSALNGDVISIIEPFPRSNLSFGASRRFTTNLTVRGEFLGKTSLAATLHDGQHSQLLLRKLFPVVVERASDTLNAVFIPTLVALIVVANVLMGCQLNLDVVWAVLKMPIAPLIGMFGQFLLMPLIAFAIGSLMLARAGEYTMALGLFTAGCAPGGGASNYWTLLLGGNVDLSVTMTFLSTLAALGLMPLWMRLLGHRFLVGHEGVHLTVPYRNIVTSLLALVVPLLIGAATKRYRENWANKSLKILRPLIVGIMVFILTFGVYANLYMFRLMTWSVLASGLALPWCGFAFGCLLSVVFRRPAADVTAIAIETGIQNSGIAIMLLKVSFPQPDADMSAVIPVVVSLFTPVPLLFAVAIHKIGRYLSERNKRMGKMRQDECGNGCNFTDAESVTSCIDDDHTEISLNNSNGESSEKLMPSFAEPALIETVVEGVQTSVVQDL